MSNAAKSQKISVTCRTCGVTESFYSSISVKHFKLNHAGHDIVDGSEVALPEVRSVRQQAVTEKNSENEPGVKLSKVMVELANFPALSRPVFRVRGMKDDGEEAFVQVMVYEESAKVRGLLARGQYLDSGFSELLYVWEPEAVEYSDEAMHKLGLRREIVEPTPEPEVVEGVPEPESETVPAPAAMAYDDSTVRAANTFDDSTVRAANEDIFDMRPTPREEVKDAVFPSFLGAPDLGDPVPQAEWPEPVQAPAQPELQVEPEPEPEPALEPLAAPLPEPEPVKAPEPEPELPLEEAAEPIPEPIPIPSPEPIRHVKPEVTAPALAPAPEPEPVKAPLAAPPPPRLRIVETIADPRLARIPEQRLEPKRAPPPPPPRPVPRPVLKPIERPEVKPEVRLVPKVTPAPVPMPTPVKVKQKKGVERKPTPRAEPEKEEYLLVSKSWYIEETSENRKEAVRISKILSAFRWKVEPIYTIGVMIDDIISIETSRNEFTGALIRKMERSGYALSAVTTDTGKPIAWFKRTDDGDAAFKPAVSG